MLNKKQITDLKLLGGYEVGQYLTKFEDAKSIVQILEWLGHLPPNFNGEFCVELLSHKNTAVRLWAVKTIGKLNDPRYLELLSNVTESDIDTTVRREAVSSIGRMRLVEGKPYLLKSLKDNDPKIVCQAIRGLLIFKGDPKIDKKLSALISHENETVVSLIQKEYSTSKSKQSDQDHTNSIDLLRNLVVHSETVAAMSVVPDESVHLTFTSPPYYNARDYSIYPSYKFYLEFLAETFRQVHRITKEGRFLVLNTSPVIVPRISRSHSSKRYPIPFDIHPYLVDMGWEFVDDIIWLKPEASVKNRVGGFMQHRKPLGYKPNSVTEYLMVYRKSSDKLLDWNIKQYDLEIVEKSKVKNEFDSNNVWEIDPSYSKSHSAVFPSELCRRVIQYYSYKGDLVFDPFGGSGTVAETASKMERFFFLTEMDDSYFNVIKSKNFGGLLSEVAPKFHSFKEFEKLIKKINKTGC